MANTSKYLKNIASPKGLKYIGYGLLIVLLLVFGSKVIRFFKKLFNGTLGDEADNEKADSITKDIKKKVSEPDYKSLLQSKSYYEAIANDLERAMEGWGTDWNKMIQVLSPLNEKELIAVYVLFGGRVNKDFVNDAYDLFGWYNDEYSTWSIPCLTAWPKLVAIWDRTSLQGRPQTLTFLGL